ncbi:MAG: glycosyltransferase family 39 protein [Acidimicrobiia bacterium]
MDAAAPDPAHPSVPLLTNAQRAAIAMTDRHAWRLDAALLAVAAVAIRLPMLLATRALVFDDGVFASSALAMRAGELPFRDVFSSQGPAFLPLVFLGDVLGGRTLDAPRVVAVLAGAVLTVAVYACARRLTTRAAALLAAGLVTTSGSVLWVTGPVNADGPALALSVVAVALALRYRDEPRLRVALLVGLAGGVALSIKFLAVPAVVVAGTVVLVSHRRVRHAIAASAVAVAVYVVTALPWGLDRVWDQSFRYHQHAARQLSVGDALVKVLRTLWERDLAVVVALVLAGAVWALVRASLVSRVPRRDAHPLGPEAAGAAVWAALVLAALLWEPALWRAHVAHLVVPLALLAALRRPPWRVLAAAAIVVVPVAVAQRHDVLWPAGPTGTEAAVVARIASLPDRALVISDDPGLVWRAGHRVPGNFVDPSFQRVDNGDITAGTLVRAASAADVCAVVVTSPQHFGRFPGLGTRLADAGFAPERFGPRITLYARPGCDPP